MDYASLWAEIAQAALNYIVVSTISTTDQKQTVTDLKTDLRTTKEDLMSGLKITEEQVINQVKESQKGGQNG